MMSPAQHFAEADRLLSRDVVRDNPTMPIARAYIARAHAHAILATCADDWLEDEPHNGYASFPAMETREATGERL